MYRIRIEGEFAAAHRLSHYHGKCERLHGHNYRVRVWASGRELGEGGMLADFSIVKAALERAIALLDHSDLNDVAEFAGDPSAERIAKYLFDRIGADSPDIPLSAVDVFETGRNMASYSPD